jgi:hypothetical protein
VRLLDRQQAQRGGGHQTELNPGQRGALRGHPRQIRERERRTAEQRRR